MSFAKTFCSTVVANEFGNIHFGRRLRFSWCDVTSSKIFSQLGMHTQLLPSQKSSGTAGLFVHTQMIIPDFICRNCRIQNLYLTNGGGCCNAAE